MPTYPLLKHDSGGPERHPNCGPMEEWTPEEISAHIAFQHEVARMLRERGEFVDAQALSSEGTYVRCGGPDAAPVTTNGPFPEAEELVAGWFLIDAIRRRARMRLPPTSRRHRARAGSRSTNWLEVRPVMSEVPAATE
jgi:hypothetical protein